MIKHIFKTLLPVNVDNTMTGWQLPFYGFALYAIISMVRSFIHLLAPDGGAGSIAGLNLSVAGADGIIFAFGLWGSSQLLFAIIQLLVVFRYRSLIPFMWLMLILEVLLRQLVGQMKPVAFAHTPPGAIGNEIILPMAALMVAMSVWSTYRQTSEAK